MSLGLSKYNEIPGSQCFTLSLKSKLVPLGESERQTDRQTRNTIEKSRFPETGMYEILTAGSGKSQ